MSRARESFPGWMPYLYAADGDDPGDVLGFVFSVWQYRTEQATNRLANEQQAAKDALERAERVRKETEAAQRELMKAGHRC